MERPNRIEARPGNTVATLLTLLMLCASSAAAGADGTLRVSVESPEGGEVAGVEVVVEAEGRPVRRSQRTGAAGEAIFLALPAADYTIEARSAQAGAAVTGVALRANQTLEVRLRLAELGVSETVRVEADWYQRSGPTVVHHLEPEALQPLPLSRSVQGLVQLVPGVTVVPNSTGFAVGYEPSSKAGNFYDDRGARIGSKDNVYYLDGFDYSSMGGGGPTFDVSTDVLATADVITSGNPASYGGGAGYVLDAVTRSGGPSWQGSASLFLEDPSLRDSVDTDDSRLVTPAEERLDVGATAGGPLLDERYRLFLSARQWESESDVTLSSSASAQPRETAYRNRRDLLFARSDLALGDRDSLVVSYYSEPQELSGSRDVNAPPNRYSRLDVDHDLWTLGYGRVFRPDLLLEARGYRSRRIGRLVPEAPAAGPRNDLLFAPGQSVPAYERQLGSSGDGSEQRRNRDQIDLGVDFLVGRHELELGARFQRWEESNGVFAPFGYSLTSIDPALSGLTLAEATGLLFLPPSELDVVLRQLQSQPGHPAFAVVDANADGTVTRAELEAATLDSWAGNPYGLNFLRSETVRAGVNPVSQDNVALFAQDRWRRGRFTLSAGVRLEDRSYEASDGSTILDMDWQLLPRLGAAFDLSGDGSHQLSLAYGEYADPLLSPMIRFAGNLSGSVFEDQIRLGEEWFTYRVRGSAVRNRDAIFAPGLENETEEEIQLSYFGRPFSRLTLLAQLFHRRDRNLIEDYDPVLYFDPSIAGDLALRPEDFGFTDGVPTGVNYFLGNLVGGERETWGLDLSADYRRPGRFSTSVQYSWRDAEGNSNSNASADLQGDLLTVDPRQPWMYGDLPGTIEHQLKAFGSVATPIGLEIGALLYWNSGAVFTESDIFRPTSSGIYRNHQRADGTFVRTGTETHPSYTTLDLRLRYPLQLSPQRGLRLDLLFDVFNALDEQGALRVEEGRNDPEFGYGEPRLLLEPRRYQVGVRLWFGGAR